MAEKRQAGFRLTEDLISAGKDRAREEGVSLTKLVEAALVDRLGLSPALTDPRLRLDDLDRRLEDFGQRLERIERAADQRGVTL
jgi:hypothetical protein